MRHARTIKLVPDGPLPDPVKGRGTPWAIEHRYSTQHSESFDDGWGTLDQAVQQEHLPPATQIIEERVKSILASNDSPDVHFDLSINPYRGCEHGCVYCFARPTHSYLNLSPGLDFETKIVAKVNAAEKLREALSRPGYRPMMLNIGSATDAVSADRAQARHHPLGHRGPGRVPPSVLAGHQVVGIERDLDIVAPMAADRLVAGVRVDHLAGSGARAHPRAARRGAAPSAAHGGDARQGRRARRRERLADHPVHQRAELERILAPHARPGPRRRSPSCCACRGR
jgi:hypothetical protein